MMGAILSPLRSQRAPLFEWWRSVDHWLLFMFVLLLLTGLLLSISASPAAAARLKLSEPLYFFFRHSLFALFGLMVALGVSLLPVETGRRFAMLSLLVMIGLLWLVHLEGVEVNGSRRWLNFGPLSLQPSEFTKPAFIVFVAWIFSLRKQVRHPYIYGLLLLIYGVLVALLFRQPDFGQLIFLTLCFLCLCFFAGISVKIMSILLCSTLGLSLLAYGWISHVRKRIHDFFDPQAGTDYQVEMAREAMAQGGLFGRGPGQGEVKFNLPDAHTDFIFAVAVEEFGVILALLMVGLLAGFVWRSYRNAVLLNDYFCQLAVAGLASMIGVQMVINLLVNLRLIPVKGMTLPFLSYGGSSLLSLSLSVGLILTFTRHRAGAYGYGV